jgi:CubicO group peptidase (beta-lactamase class C family)
LLAAWVLGTTTVTVAADRVGDFVNAYLKKKQVPGCALMVRHNGKVVLADGYGFANLEHRVRVTPQTVFQSGSVGKQFTAMAVMLLVEERKLALDEPI